MFPDDTFLFSKVQNPLETANTLKKDLEKTRDWVEQWKMAFNPDTTKHAQEVLFSKKTRESFHSTFYFSKFVVTKVQSHKHLWHKLDKKLGIKDRHKDKFAKVNR